MDFMMTKALRTATGANAKTITSLIPDNPRKLKKVQEAGGTFMYRYQDMIKTPKWLKANGFCMDYMEEGVSKIPNAGRGAFATRNIQKGETITITPMIHIADKSLLTMYKIVEVKDEEDGRTLDVYDKEEGPIGKQLAMNYCFGHPESSLLLFPIGPQVTLINNGGGKSNAFITWTKQNDPITNPKGYLELSVDEMAKVKEVALVMKVVARTDIAAGEEITLNYGQSWQTAWDVYEKEWNAANADSVLHPLKADEVRILYKDKPFETVDTLAQTQAYPKEVKMACFLETRERPDGIVMTDQKFGHGISEFDDPTTYEAYHGNSLFLVDIKHRHPAPGFFYNYTVLAHLRKNKVEEVVNVPHSACTFIDDSYTSDIHRTPQFRHPIGISDSHFPLAWRDLQ